jgi:predicted phosphodiesterase
MSSKRPYYHAIAFISDIHGNIEALDAVLEDIKKQKASGIYCLGDLVGYGTDPKAVIQKIVSLKESHELFNIVCGNHDYGVYNKNFAVFQNSARLSNEWTLKQIEGTPEFHFLEEISKSELLKEVGRFRLVHSTCQPEPVAWEYLRTKNAPQNFEERKITFVGHSHIPAIYSKYSSGKGWNPITLFENDGYYYLPKPKEEPMETGKVITEYRLNVPGSFPTMIVNIGSVGQPRDGSSYARYILYITVDVNNYIEFRQVGYDIKTTVSKLKARGLECDQELATRLCTGGKSTFDPNIPRPDWFPFS